MSVKWIKITTDIFDDEKIKIIDTLPARDEIIVIWFKLLTLAGKTNQSGMLFLNSKIPYTTDMLAAIFNRDLNSVKFAIETFKNYGMIEIEENQVISIINWEKHQNVEGLEKIRSQAAERQKRFRNSKKIMLESNVTRNVTVTEDNATEEELEEDIELELIKRIVEYLNNKTSSKFKHTSSKTKSMIRTRFKEGYVIEDFIKVIDIKYEDWKSSDMEKYLRPETLFSNKFEGYLNQKNVSRETSFTDHSKTNKYSNEQLEDYLFNKNRKE